MNRIKPDEVIRPVGETSSRKGCNVVGDEHKGASFGSRGNSAEPCYTVEGQDELDLGSGDERDPEEAGEDLGTEKPRVIRSPHAPSRQEVIEHNITHCPFRSWCPECVMGKSKCDPHISTSGESDRTVPLVAMDYAFMSDKTKNAETEEESRNQAKILVCRDRNSRCYNAFSVPHKGVDSDEYAVRRSLKFLEFLGYESLILKTDQESALSKVIAGIKAHRGKNTQTMAEQSPAYDSKSNGFIERAIQSLEGQVRTMKLALEKRIGERVTGDMNVIHWLIEYAATILTLFEVGPDGKVPFQRLRGRKLKHRLA